MRLPRFGRFLNGAGGDGWIDYHSQENWWEKEEREKRDADIRRGSWVVSDPLTPEEEEEWKRIKYDYDLYEEVEETNGYGKTRKVWALKDPGNASKFGVLSDKKDKHEGSLNYATCRLPPAQYYTVRDRVQKEGIGKRWVRFFTDSDTGFSYIKVDFASDDPDLLNGPAGQALQAQNPAGYHITICYDKTYKEDPGAKKATDAIAEKYGQWWQEIEMKDISISSGDTYQIEGDSEFARDLRNTVAITLAGYKNNPNYKAHISMD